MKPPITLSINPTYYCNQRCSFCYLTEKQLSDKHFASLNTVRTRLEALQARYDIEHVDLYGGEVFMLPKRYLKDLKELLLQYCTSINVVTNLTTSHPMLNDPDFYLTVSWDGVARDHHLEVLDRMAEIDREFSILMCASPEFLKQDPLEIFLMLAQVPNIRSVEIKPYSENQANHHGSLFVEFEEWVKAFIEIPLAKHFTFVNEDHIRDSLAKRRNAFSDDHIYLTPQGTWAVLEFDENDCEFFLEMSDLDAYLAWTQKEKNRVKEGSYCKGCEFQGHCLTEHFRHVEHVEQSCNGFHNLLQWAKPQIKYQPEPIPISPVKPNEPVWRKNMRDYHTKTKDFDDELGRIRVIEKIPCWDDILEYLTERNPRLIYPAKSIAVASIYAVKLTEHFGGDVYDYVTDPDLFIGTDRYFEPYRKGSLSAPLFENMFEYLAKTPDWHLTGWVPETLRYFEKECL